MRILFVGPLLPPVHGQSLAFTRFYESIDLENKFLINTNMKTGTKYISTVKILFLILQKIFFYKIDAIYFTCSRSFMGSIKDILLINLASLKNIRLINHLHGSDFYDFLHTSSYFYKKILFKSYSKVDTSIVLLDSMRSQFIDFKNMNIEVVSNFYDKDLDVKMEEKDEKKINILFLSNIITSKGIFELLEAFDGLSKKYEYINLSVAGDFIADEYTSLSETKKHFFDKIDSNSKISYLGNIFGVDKVRLLQKSDIFVLPSYYKSEAFPISIIEAMRCANAIVTTNYKYLPSIVKSENGILVEPKSVDSLFYGIEKLLCDVDNLRKIQKHNSHEAKDKYSLDKYINRLQEIVLGNKY